MRIIIETDEGTKQVTPSASATTVSTDLTGEQVPTDGGGAPGAAGVSAGSEGSVVTDAGGPSQLLLDTIAAAEAAGLTQAAAPANEAALVDAGAAPSAA